MPVVLMLLELLLMAVLLARWFITYALGLAEERVSQFREEASHAASARADDNDDEEEMSFVHLETRTHRVPNKVYSRRSRR